MTSPVSPGDVLLEKYRVERVLGSGGMGVVVAARHIALGELFAIKFLLPAALAHPDAMERFLREARASARLKGEHVVRVQDVGCLPEGLPYMVMDHLSGSDLKDVVRQRGPLPATEAITYVLQACEALAEAHALGIVHRDIKPANMFLIRQPNGAPCVKVLDFGISKQLGQDGAEQQVLTQTGMVLGSPAYMAPEQMMRTKEADPRSDIWSMGVVLYQLLTGAVPFQAEAFTELIGKVLQEEPEPPSRHRADIPPAIDAVVMTCLRKRREERFQTTLQLMEALQAAMSASAPPPRAPFPSAPLSDSFASQGQGTMPLAPVSAGPPMVGPPTFPVAGNVRPPQPSQPFLADGGTPPPRPSFASIHEPGGAAGPAWNPGAVGNAPTGQAAQTGQAWGATENRTLPPSAQKRAYAGVIAAVASLVLSGAAVLAIWQYRSGDTATLATTNPTFPADSSANGIASSDATTTLDHPASTAEPATTPTTAGAVELPATSEITQPGAVPTAQPSTSSMPVATPTATAPAAAGARPKAVPTGHPVAAATTKPTATTTTKLSDSKLINRD